MSYLIFNQRLVSLTWQWKYLFIKTFAKVLFYFKHQSARKENHSTGQHKFCVHLVLYLFRRRYSPFLFASYMWNYVLWWYPSWISKRHRKHEHIVKDYSRNIPTPSFNSNYSVVSYKSLKQFLWHWILLYRKSWISYQYKNLTL